MENKFFKLIDGLLVHILGIVWKYQIVALSIRIVAYYVEVSTSSKVVLRN